MVRLHNPIVHSMQLHHVSHGKTEHSAVQFCKKKLNYLLLFVVIFYK